MVTEFNKVFLDTAPIIYFLDDDIKYSEKMEQIFEEFIRTETIMITSTVTCTEYLTYPYRTNNHEKVDAFFEFLTDCSIQIIPIDLYAAMKKAWPPIGHAFSLHKLFV